MEIVKDINKKYEIDKLSNLEKARLLYIELGKCLSFSTKYQNSTIVVMGQMLKANVDLNTFNDNEVNCVMWAQLYSQLLDKFNIKNKIVGSSHKFVEFYIDEKVMIADATNGEYHDLSRIHNGDDTSHFGPSLYQFENDRECNIVKYDPKFADELKEIDIKIGYNDEKYKDLKELKEIISNIYNGNLDINLYVKGQGDIINKKLQFLFAKIGVVDLGYYEAKDYLRNLEKYLLTKEELECVKSNQLLRTNKDGSVDIMQIISVNNDGNYKYYLLAPKKAIREVRKDEIIKFSLIRYGIDEDKSIPGISYPKNFIPGEIKKGIKYKLERLSEKRMAFKNPLLREYDKVSHYKR